jgi:hypothetical protein
VSLYSGSSYTLHRAKPHGNGVERAQEGNGVDCRPYFRCARRHRRRGAWEVQSWLERELYESQKNVQWSGLLSARPHKGCKQNRREKLCRNNHDSVSSIVISHVTRDKGLALRRPRVRISRCVCYSECEVQFRFAVCDFVSA